MSRASRKIKQIEQTNWIKRTGQMNELVWIEQNEQNKQNQQNKQNKQNKWINSLNIQSCAVTLNSHLEQMSYAHAWMLRRAFAMNSERSIVVETDHVIVQTPPFDSLTSGLCPSAQDNSGRLIIRSDGDVDPIASSLTSNLGCAILSSLHWRSSPGPSWRNLTLPPEDRIPDQSRGASISEDGYWPSNGESQLSSTSAWVIEECGCQDYTFVVSGYWRWWMEFM